MRIWIDTDIGSDVDDALTLAYLLAHPGLEVVGVSTVFGDVALRTRIAEELLALANRCDIDVLTGLGVPLTPRKRGVMFGHEGQGLVEGPEPILRVDTEPQHEERIDKIAAAIGNSSPDVVLAIGPLTNVGALIGAGVELPPLTIMGGKFSDVTLAGMVDSIPEWNWFCDPRAVQITLDASHDELPLVVPAEVTFRTQLEEGDPALLGADSDLNRALERLCVAWLDLQRDSFGRLNPRVALHDPLTAALLAHPDLCPVEPLCVSVDDQGASILADGQPNLNAATDVDPSRVRAHIMDTLISSRPSSMAG